MATANYVDEADHQQTLTKTLYTAACDYLMRGWSVLPLVGSLNPKFTKRPAIKSWKSLQQQQPMTTDLQRWFLELGYQGLGVICGRVSALLVFDFDCPERAAAFVHQFPQLANTYTVCSGTRRLPHFYYTIAADVPSAGWSVPGLDVRGDGQYVAAPPTASDSGSWQVINNAVPQPLNFGDFSAIFAFFNPTPQQPAISAEKSSFESLVHYSDLLTPTLSETFLSNAGLVAYYRTLAPDRGRNNALFAAARLARDTGWSQTETAVCLTALHVAQPSAHPHTPETPAERLKEAHQTIASVYSRPPSPRVDLRPITGLPNALREYLLNAGVQTTAAARVMDALLLSGWQAGQLFSEREAFEQVQPLGIGRRSVRAALAALLDGMPIFAEAASPSPAPLPAAGAATGSAVETNKCFVGRVSERVKMGRGRPAVQFVLPSPRMLCKRLGIEPRASDPLDRADFAHPAYYRRAQHRTLIARRPGQYGRAWLAERLGVSAQTARRYDRQLGMHVQPVFAQSSITHSSARSLASGSGRSSDEMVAGVFLEAEDGRRYPALQVVAQQLLKQGHSLVLKRQLPNYYRLNVHMGSIDPISPTVRPVRKSRYAADRSLAERAAAPAHKGSIDPLYVKSLSELSTSSIGVRQSGEANAARNPLFIAAAHSQQHHAHMGSIDPLSAAPAQPSAPVRPIVILLDSAPKPPRPPRNFRDPLADAAQEALAQRLCAVTSEVNSKCALSQSVARQLVLTYSAAAVQRALRTLSQRRTVENPAGFLIIVLRSETGIPFKQRKSRRKPKPRLVQSTVPTTTTEMLTAVTDPLAVYIEPQTGHYDPAAHQRALYQAAVERSRQAFHQHQQALDASPYARFVKQPPPDWVPPASFLDPLRE